MSLLQFNCAYSHASGFQLQAKFHMEAGITALFGASGAGKSTTLALIAGVLQPTSGTIYLGDRCLVNVARGVFLPPEQRQIGIVFQEHLLFPHFSVRQNLLFGAQRGGKSIALERVAQVLELTQYLDRAPRYLSGGQQQRVALGRALLRGPQLLLLDEPLAALDSQLKDRVLTYVERIVQEWKVPTLFVSHDQSDVRRLAQQTVMLAEGRVLTSGNTADILDHALLRSSQDSPRLLNLLLVRQLQKVEEHWVGQVGEYTIRLPVLPPNGTDSVYVQFSPHDVLLSRAALTGVSARNHLIGVVREVVTLPEQVFVAVDVGQFLWCEVTREAVQELEIKIGCTVHCFIKTSAFTLLH
jgi:molybdate transport system ATP-binding protein